MYNLNFRQHGCIGSVICNTSATRDKILTFNNISALCSTNGGGKISRILSPRKDVVCIHIHTLYLAFNAAQGSCFAVC